MVLLFLFCNILALVINILEAFVEDMSPLLLNYLTDTSNFLVLLNGSVNYVIYMIFSKPFFTLFWLEIEEIFIKIYWNFMPQICSKYFLPSSILRRLASKTTHVASNNINLCNHHLKSPPKTKSAKTYSSNPGDNNNIHKPLLHSDSQAWFFYYVIFILEPFILNKENFKIESLEKVRIFKCH